MDNSRLLALFGQSALLRPIQRYQQNQRAIRINNTVDIEALPLDIEVIPVNMLIVVDFPTVCQYEEGKGM